MTLEQQPPGTYLVCPICFWEDTGERYGLRVSQRNFLEFGACDRQWSNRVRPPTAQDRRIANWQPLDVPAEIARLAVIQQITKAFEGVSREDGVSLHEARVIDDWGGEEERVAARKIDTDIRWQDVPVEWIEKLYDAFSFLDAKGWRYYLPAYMLYSLKFYTTNSMAVDSAVYSCILYEDKKSQYKDLKEYQLSRFGLLTVDQSRAVCQFLRFQVAYEEGDGLAAQKALDAYWSRFCSEGDRPDAGFQTN